VVSFKVTKWSPSLRTKVIFFGLACVVLLGFCLTLATLYAVEARKRQIVGHAQEVVETSADQWRDLLAKWLEEEKATDLNTLLQSTRFREAVRFLASAKENRAVQVTVFNNQNRIVARLSQDEHGRILYQEMASDPGKDLRVEVDTTETSDATTARRTILHGGQPKGDVSATYVPSVLLNEIRNESQQITFWLAALAATLTFLLAVTFTFLWKIFRRHLERERTHEKLDRMAYIGTLASGLAHEIRNPLNALSLNLDVVGEEITDPQPSSSERTSKILDLIKSEIRRLNSTLTNFLQYALPTSGRMQMTDVVAVLQETATLLEPDMRQRHVQYRFEGERSCATLADPVALRQVFWNVLLNAVQALEERNERRIVASCRVEGGECRIEIRDTGPGVPADRREQVFEVFHSTRPGGSGFGLAIARQVVTRHGGSIWINSCDGWGCVVHIRLPLKVGKEGNRVGSTR